MVPGLELFFLLLLSFVLEPLFFFQFLVKLLVDQLPLFLVNVDALIVEGLHCDLDFLGEGILLVGVGRFLFYVNFVGFHKNHHGEHHALDKLRPDSLCRLGLEKFAVGLGIGALLGVLSANVVHKVDELQLVIHLVPRHSHLPIEAKGLPGRIEHHLIADRSLGKDLFQIAKGRSGVVSRLLDPFDIKTI